MGLALSQDLVDGLNFIYERDEANARHLALLTVLIEEFEDDFVREAERIYEFNKSRGLSQEELLKEGNLWADLAFAVGGSLPYIGAPIAAVGAGYYIAEFLDTDGWEAGINLLMAVLSIFQAIGSLLAVGGVPLGIAKGVLLPIKGLGWALKSGASLTRTQRLTAAALREGGPLAKNAQALINTLKGMQGPVKANFIRQPGATTTPAAQQIMKFLGVSADDAVRISERMGKGFDPAVASLDDLIRGVRTGRLGRAAPMAKSAALVDDAGNVVKTATGMTRTVASRPSVVPTRVRKPAKAAASSMMGLAARYDSWLNAAPTLRVLGKVFGTPEAPRALGSLNLGKQARAAAYRGSPKSSVKSSSRLQSVDDAVMVGLKPNASGNVVTNSDKILFRSETLAAATGRPASYQFTTQISKLPPATQERLIRSASSNDAAVGTWLQGLATAATRKGNTFRPIKNFGKLGAIGQGMIVGGGAELVRTGDETVDNVAGFFTGGPGDEVPELSMDDQKVLWDQLYGPRATDEPDDYDSPSELVANPMVNSAVQ